MRIAFLQETLNQNIGIMYLSALSKSNGHECKLFIESLEADFAAAVNSYRPDIIGFSVITGAHHWVLNMASYLKKMLPNVLIILGGPHPTYFPDIINKPPVDIIARGEAEVSFIELINKLSRKQDYSAVKGLWVKRDNLVYRNDIASLVEDLSSLPYPDHGLYTRYPFFKKQSEIPFSTTRGCPFRCSFCYNHVKADLYRNKGKYLRINKVDKVIGEMKLARSIYPNMRSVIFYDDIIGMDKKWLIDFSSKYSASINMPWFTSIRADFVDEFVAEQLAKTNCFCLSIGLETGDVELREKILGKKISDSQYVRASKILHNVGIKVRTSNMLFLPGEDINKAIKTVDLNRKMKVDFAWAYTFQPYPGTEIYDYAVNEGYLSPAFKFDNVDPLGLIRPIINVEDKNKILVLHRIFHFAVHNKVIYKLLKIIVLIPPNPLFDLIYFFSLILSYAEYHKVSVWRAIHVGWNNYCSTKNIKNGY